MSCAQLKVKAKAKPKPKPKARSAPAGDTLPFSIREMLDNVSSCCLEWELLSDKLQDALNDRDLQLATLQLSLQGITKEEQLEAKLEAKALRERLVVSERKLMCSEAENAILRADLEAVLSRVGRRVSTQVF